MAIVWTTQLNAYPAQSWAFVLAAQNPYALFLSCRVDQFGWRAFVIPNARNPRDLFGGEGIRWSADVFVEHGVTLKEEQIGEAQAALLRILASRLGVQETDIQSARNGKPLLTRAQLTQIARTQPQRRR